MTSSVLITGAGSGIGLAIAEHFIKKDYFVTVTDINEAQLQQARNRLPNDRCQFLPLDVTQASSVTTLVEKIQRQPDVVINNAGIQYVAHLEEFPMEKWDFLIQVMLVGVARVTQAFLPHMKQQNYGRIINIGSLHSIVASPYKTAYIAAKHGLIGFAKSLALELGQHDITINTVCPGYVKTPLVEQQIAQQAKEHQISEQQVIDTIMLKPMPKKAFIETSEIAGTCEFLLSPAAINMTAQALVLDGGWTAQ
ncbi:3-hydroxybutyrate dehydrogenase [Pleionea mediterranea]|uniref:3-hydroxybutyrate dehydrogenase n=1 Tax=Pleionea mediterranea TaxID=523701 RepID=A0A316FQ52_9GAMM|nr:3-hydroxybutyrate dehydrogenase [Pleionea mediterranea]PWK50901.1 3-hydroxybutyrate dehydrogenase [Pleionea mediterranea]